MLQVTLISLAQKQSWQLWFCTRRLTVNVYRIISDPRQTSITWLCPWTLVNNSPPCINWWKLHAECRPTEKWHRVSNCVLLMKCHCHERYFPLHRRDNERGGVLNQRRLDCLLIRLFRRRSKKASKLRVIGLCKENSPVTGEFPAQKASNAENVSIWWRHHAQSISHRKKWELSWCQLCYHWWLSLTTCGATGDDKVGIMKTLDFQCILMLQDNPMINNDVLPVSPVMKGFHENGTRNDHQVEYQRFCSLLMNMTHQHYFLTLVQEDWNENVIFTIFFITGSTKSFGAIPVIKKFVKIVGHFVAVSSNLFGTTTQYDKTMLLWGYHHPYYGQ